MKTRNCIINGAADFFQAVKVQSKVKVTLVSAESVRKRATSLNLEKIFQEAVPIPGISGFHCIQQVGSGYITRKYTSAEDGAKDANQNFADRQ